MALIDIQNQLAEALATIDDSLRIDAQYRFTANVGEYDPASDSFTESQDGSINLNVLKGNTLTENSNERIYRAEVKQFLGAEPSTNDKLFVEGKTWNISKIARDALGLMYAFTVENKDGF